MNKIISNWWNERVRDFMSTGLNSEVQKFNFQDFKAIQRLQTSFQGTL